MTNARYRTIDNSKLSELKNTAKSKELLSLDSLTSNTTPKIFRKSYSGAKIVNQYGIKMPCKNVIEDTDASNAYGFDATAGDLSTTVSGPSLLSIVAPQTAVQVPMAVAPC